MAERNEHHFVPQFYLRRFSEDGRRINLINLARNLFVRNASIKHQCAIRKFYDWDPNVEPALSALEGATAEVLRRIDRTHTPPSLGASDFLVLRTFAILQRARTLGSADGHDAMTDSLFKAAYPEFGAERGIRPDMFRMVNIHPAALPMRAAAELSLTIDHLGLHVLLNGCKQPFITSDNPVVLHNQYCEGIYYRGVLGWRSAGLQVIWPISSQLVLLFYDTRIYKIAAGRASNSTVIHSVAEIDQINALQIVNATHNIYFRDLEMAPLLLESTKRLARARTYQRVERVLTDTVTVDGETSQLLHLYERMCPLRFNIGALRTRKNAKRVPLDQRGGGLRRYTAADAPAFRRAGLIRYPVTHTSDPE